MSDIDKPAIRTEIGALRVHHAAAQRQPSVEAKPDTLTERTQKRIEGIQSRADYIARKSEVHFAKHRAVWINRQHAKLLMKAAPSIDLAPSWAANDRKSHLRRAAANMVDHRQSKRLKIIQKAATREIAKAAGKAISQARKKNRDTDRGR